jgi:hypothetical protein
MSRDAECDETHRPSSSAGLRVHRHVRRHHGWMADDEQAPHGRTIHFGHQRVATGWRTAQSEQLMRCLAERVRARGRYSSPLPFLVSTVTGAVVR